jgi:hypothetical protein
VFIQTRLSYAPADCPAEKRVRKQEWKDQVPALFTELFSNRLEVEDAEECVGHGRDLRADLGEDTADEADNAGDADEAAELGEDATDDGLDDAEQGGEDGGELAEDVAEEGDCAWLAVPCGREATSW